MRHFLRGLGHVFSFGLLHRAHRPLAPEQELDWAFVTLDKGAAEVLEAMRRRGE